MVSISALNLSSQQMAEYSQIMVKGNIPLKNAAEMIGMQNRKFRSKLFRGKFDPKAVDNGERVWPDMTVEAVNYINEHYQSIMAVREIEWPMVRAFSRLAKKQAAGWAKMASNGLLTIDDYYQEALLAVVDAVYGYSKPEWKFITFVFWSIKRRLITAINASNPFPLPNEAISLRKRYAEAEEKINGPASIDEICDVAGFTDRERNLVATTFVSVARQSDMLLSNKDESNQEEADYTGMRRGLDNEETIRCNYEIKEAFSQADLTSFERKVVETYLDPFHGWQTKLASEEINPRTGQFYTRAAIAVILEKALKKIKAAYQQVA